MRFAFALFSIAECMAFLLVEKSSRISKISQKIYGQYIFLNECMKLGIPPPL